MISVLFTFIICFEECLPRAGAIVFSICLIFFHIITNQAMVWSLMETGDGFEDGWTFGGLRSSQTSWIKLSFFGGGLGKGCFFTP